MVRLSSRNAKQTRQLSPPSVHTPNARNRSESSKRLARGTGETVQKPHYFTRPGASPVLDQMEIRTKVTHSVDLSGQAACLQWDAVASRLHRRVHPAVQSVQIRKKRLRR